MFLTSLDVLFRFLYSVGVMQVYFLNNLLKYSAFSYPISLEISAIFLLEFSRYPFAIAILNEIMYCKMK